MFLANEQSQASSPLINFYRDPFVEAVISLHALGDPNHHHDSSAILDKINSLISLELHEQIIYFNTNYANFYTVISMAKHLVSNQPLFIEDYEQIFGQRLAQLAALNDAEFIYLFVHISNTGPSKEQVLNWLLNVGSLENSDFSIIEGFFNIEIIKSILKDINGFRRQLISLLNNYWQMIFKHIWPNIAKSTEQIAQSLSLYGLSTDAIVFLSGIHHDLNYKDGILIARQHGLLNISLNEVKNINIFFSVFSSPHLLLDADEECFNICYNIDISYLNLFQSLNSTTLDGLKALGEDNRLRILKIIWDQSVTTKNLAKMLSLSQSTVSIHLKILKQAKLVEHITVKKNVFYKANHKQVQKIWHEMNSYLNNS